MRVELYLPGRTSLKEKRKTVRSLIDGLCPRYGAAAAEVDLQELHQRAAIGLGLVGGTPSEVRQRAQSLLDALRDRPDIEVVGTERTEVSPEAA